MSRGRNRRMLGIVLIAVGFPGLGIYLTLSAMWSYPIWTIATNPMMCPMSGMKGRY